jgi:hypothetical protein
MTAIGRRRPSVRQAVVVVLVLAVLGSAFGAGLVSANAFGLGDKFERLVARVERLITGPPPADRATVPTVTITAPPATPPPTPAPSLPSGAPPTPTPTPLVRAPVDVIVVPNPEAVFAHEIRKDWCAPAGIQMTLASLGLADNSDAFQKQLAGRIHEWETYADSHNYEWGPSAMASALAAYGAPGYEIHAYDSRGLAMHDAAVAISRTRSPAILLAWRGAHTWVMTGYRADADPLKFADATISGTYILDPWYPWVSSIWGASDPPGTFQDLAEMKRNFLPWKRPEGKYPDRDGKFIVLVPTLPAPNASR